MASPDSQARRSRKHGRLRARALWAFVLGAIVLGAALAGLVQYVRSDALSVGMGGESFRGIAAVEALVALFLVSSGFLAVGLILRGRARRGSSS